jgi:enoyl-CoA hydratase
MRNGVSDPVLIEVRGRTLVVTLNRPQARNAVDQTIADGVAAALDRLEADEALSAAVLTGAGRGFCSGMDLNAFLSGSIPVAGGRGFAGIVERPARKLVIAAVEGFAVAGGLEVALACDIIVAARGAKLGLPEVKRGLVPAGGGLRRLSRRVPHGAALELALTGELVPAERAYELGLVDHLVDPGTALTEALSIAERIAAIAPLALLATKRILLEETDWSERDFWVCRAEVAEAAMCSEDAVEGAQAFAEKRAPVWKGKAAAAVRQPVHDGFRALLAEHDRCWQALDGAKISNLWDLQCASVVYLGDECGEPVVGPAALRQHYSRMVSRLAHAEVCSELVTAHELGPDVAMLTARMRWTFTVAGQPPASGTSWVGATARRIAVGWRFVQYVERLAAVDQPPDES